MLLFWYSTVQVGESPRAEFTEWSRFVYMISHRLFYDMMDRRSFVSYHVLYSVCGDHSPARTIAGQNAETLDYDARTRLYGPWYRW